MINIQEFSPETSDFLQHLLGKTITDIKTDFDYIGITLNDNTVLEVWEEENVDNDYRQFYKFIRGRVRKVNES